jgi:hypothetical protein
LLFILFEIIYEIKYIFLFHLPSIFLYVRFGSHLFNKFKKNINKLFSNLFSIAYPNIVKKNYFIFYNTYFLVLAWSKVRVPGFDRVTGSPGSNFFKNQNDVFLVKKTKVNGLQPGF